MEADKEAPAAAADEPSPDEGETAAIQDEEEDADMDEMAAEAGTEHDAAVSQQPELTLSRVTYSTPLSIYMYVSIQYTGWQGDGPAQGGTRL